MGKKTAGSGNTNKTTQSAPSGKPTKKEISRRKEAARVKRKEAADKRKADKPAKERENPITAKLLQDGTFEFHGRSFSPSKDKNAALEPFGKELLQRGRILEILPTDQQAERIRQFNGCARVARNDYLEQRIAAYQKDKSTLSVSEYKAGRLKEFKEEKPWLKDADKFALESAIEYVDDAYQNFFDGRADFPKFVSKWKPNGNCYTTKMTNNNIKVVQGEDGLPYIQLPKLGLVRFVLPKNVTLDQLFLPGSRITKATVSKVGDKYTVSLAVEAVVDRTTPIKMFERSRFTAMDMGNRKFCDYMDNDGGYIHL